MIHTHKSIERTGFGVINRLLKLPKKLQGIIMQALKILSTL